MFKRLFLITLLFFSLSLFANASVTLSTMNMTESILHTPHADCEDFDSGKTHQSSSETECSHCPTHKVNCCHSNLVFNKSEKNLHFQIPIIHEFTKVNDSPKASPELETPLQPPKHI